MGLPPFFFGISLYVTVSVSLTLNVCMNMIRILTVEYFLHLLLCYKIKGMIVYKSV